MIFEVLVTLEEESLNCIRQRFKHFLCIFRGDVTVICPFDKCASPRCSADLLLSCAESAVPTVDGPWQKSNFTRCSTVERFGKLLSDWTFCTIMISCVYLIRFLIRLRIWGRNKEFATFVITKNIKRSIIDGPYCIQSFRSIRLIVPFIFWYFL